MPRPTAPAILDDGHLAPLARGAAIATFLTSLYLLLARHPLGSGTLPDWVGHLVLFALLGLSVGLSVATTQMREPRTARRALVVGLLVVTLYGPLTEVAQYFVGRDAEWGDAAVDIAASLPAFALAYALPKLLRGNNEPA